MPKAKTGSVPGTSTKAIDPAVKTEAAKAATGLIPVDDIIRTMIQHNCVKNAVDGFNPNVVYAVLVLDRFNFVNEYTTFERSYLISSSSPHFIARKGGWADQKADYADRPVSPEIYGDCLDKTLDQGVRLDWYKWVYDGGYFYQPETGTMLAYDADKKSVKPLPKKAAPELTAQLIHETLLRSRLGPKYRELREKGGASIIEQGLTALAEKLKGEKATAENLTVQALESVLEGLAKVVEKAKAEAKAKAEKSEEKPEKASGITVDALVKSVNAKFTDRVKAMLKPAQEAKCVPEVRDLVGKILQSLIEGWASVGKKKLEGAMLEEAMSLLESNVRKFLDKRAAESKVKGKAGKAESKPKAETPAAAPAPAEKAKAKGPTKTEQAKSPKGKAASFPAPVKRGKK